VLLFSVWSVNYGVLSCNYSHYPLYTLKGSAAHLKFLFHLWVDTQLLSYVHLISKWVHKSPLYFWFVMWTDCAVRAVTLCIFIHVTNVSEEATALAYFKYRLIKFARICSVYAVGYRIVKLLTEVSVANLVRYTAFGWTDWNKAFRINCLQPWWRRQEFLRHVGKHETARRHTPQAHSLEPRHDENGEAPVMCL